MTVNYSGKYTVSPWLVIYTYLVIYFYLMIYGSSGDQTWNSHVQSNCLITSDISGPLCFYLKFTREIGEVLQKLSHFPYIQLIII